MKTPSPEMKSWLRPCLPGSTDVGLIVSKALYSYSKLASLYFVDSKTLISVFTVCDRMSFCARIVL